MVNNPRRPVPRCSAAKGATNFAQTQQPVRTVTQYDFGAMPLAMSYVPPQSWGETYTYEEALTRGTLFPVLDLAFKCEGGCCR